MANSNLDFPFLTLNSGLHLIKETPDTPTYLMGFLTLLDVVKLLTWSV